MMSTTQPVSTSPQLLSLFSGAGGLDTGFENAGFKTVLALDNSPEAVQSFNTNISGNVAQEADLSRLSPEAFLKMIPRDAQPVGLIGGPPCQGFSRGNVRAKLSDPRNQLPYRFARLLKAANDKYQLHFFVFENVVGLARQKHSARFKRIKSKLEKTGFNVFPMELNAGDFGVAQRRLRLFIVGLNSDLYPDTNFDFPSAQNNKKTVRDVLWGLPIPTYFKRGLRPEDIQPHRNHWTMMPKSPKFASTASTTGRSFKRLDWDSVSPTVAYGNREVHVHPDGGRRLSVYEALLLQGFKSKFRLVGSLSAQIRQVSNAVPPPVAEAIAISLKSFLHSKLSVE